MVRKEGRLHIGLVDADLLDNGTRHPNLVIMKLAGYFRDNKIPYELIIDNDADVSKYDHIYISRVFAFTKKPAFLSKLDTNTGPIIHKGGTGWYTLEEDEEKFKIERESDMTQLERDPFLPGLNLAHQMPDYDIYSEYINKKVGEGKNKDKYKDYLHYSIGFLTRGCIRHCPFCVNKNESHVYQYSNLSDFYDQKRKYIYLWDDNFLAAPKDLFNTYLDQLIATKRPFQFRQGLDIRLMTEEKAEKLSKCHYHGDWIFAFDIWQQYKNIEKHLKIWKHYCPQKTTKLYLFCGFELTEDSDEKLFDDVYHLFFRIKILMQYGCLGYVMRHADYQNHPLGNIYVQIARWCNQPQFYKKMSFEEFILRNQTYQEEKTGNENACKSLRTYEEFSNKYRQRFKEIEPFFKMKYERLINSALWI